jgi:L-lactate dehydrogenase
VASHLSLYDLDGARATADMLNLRHRLQFVRPATIDAGEAISVCTGADVVVITASTTAVKSPAASNKPSA